MANNNSGAAFLAGGLIGAAIVYLTCTENGKKTLKDGIDYLDRKLKELDKAAAENFSEGNNDPEAGNASVDEQEAEA